MLLRPRRHEQNNGEMDVLRLTPPGSSQRHGTAAPGDKSPGSRRCWITGVAGQARTWLLSSVGLFVSEHPTRRETLGQVARLFDDAAVTCRPTDGRAVQCVVQGSTVGLATLGTQHNTVQCSRGAAPRRVTMGARWRCRWPWWRQLWESAGQAVGRRRQPGVIVRMMQLPLPSVLQGVRHPGKMQVDHPEARPDQSINTVSLQFWSHVVVVVAVVVVVVIVVIVAYRQECS